MPINFDFVASSINLKNNHHRLKLTGELIGFLSIKIQFKNYMRATTSWTKANNSISGGQRLFMPMRHHARMMKYPETPQTKRPPSISQPICPLLMAKEFDAIGLGSTLRPRRHLELTCGDYGVRRCLFLSHRNGRSPNFPIVKKALNMYTGSGMDGASRFASARCEQESSLLRAWPGIIGLISSCEKLQCLDGHEQLFHQHVCSRVDADI